MSGILLQNASRDPADMVLLADPPAGTWPSRSGRPDLSADPSSEAELDLALGQVIKYLAGVWERSRETVESGDDQCVAGSGDAERLSRSAAFSVGSGQAVLDVGSIG